MSARNTAALKKEYYSSQKTIDAYHTFRYGGTSGLFVNERELKAVSDLLPERGLLLDAPCGQGRLIAYLKNEKRDIKIIGTDFSHQMISAAKKTNQTEYVIADMFHLPFKDGSFDCLVSLRFTFHYRDIPGFLREARRVIKNGGSIIFDTYRWSPLAFAVPYPKICGGRVFIHSDKKITRLLEELGLTEIRRIPNFLMSPLIYRYLPFFIVRVLNFIERHIPSSCLTVVFWKVMKHSNQEGSS